MNINIYVYIRAVYTRAQHELQIFRINISVREMESIYNNITDADLAVHSARILAGAEIW